MEWERAVTLPPLSVSPEEDNLESFRFLWGCIRKYPKSGGGGTDCCCQRQVGVHRQGPREMRRAGEGELGSVVAFPGAGGGVSR